MNIATFNIRVQVPRDKGNRSWLVRRKFVADVVKSNDFDIFGVQEMGDIIQRMSLRLSLKDYSYYGKGRNALDFINPGSEQVGIFWKKDKYNVLDKGYFYLSPKLDRTVGWDAKYVKPLVWIKFKDINGGNEFYVINTHFDHIGQVARLESARIVTNFVKGIIKLDGSATAKIIFMGDLNTNESFEPYVYNELSKSMSDSFNTCNSSFGPKGTYNAYENKEPVLVSRCDYIFTRNVEVDEYHCVNKTYDGIFPSDHFPVKITTI